jgi:predicted kinase
MRAIIMMHGLPGTGKSYIASLIAKMMDNVDWLKTVKFRKTVDEPYSPELFDENNPKTRADKDVSYREMLKAAKEDVEKNVVPILDATFHKRYRRGWVYELAQELDAKVLVVSVSCPEEIVFERIGQRNDKTDEDAFLKSKGAYELMKRQADSLTEEGLDVLHINSPEFSIKKLVAWLAERLLSSDGWVRKKGYD